MALSLDLNSYSRSRKSHDDETTSETTIEVCRVEELPPGEKRIVEAAGRKIGVFNAGGTLYAIEDRCSHDDGPLAEGPFDPERRRRRVPAPRLAVRPRDRAAEDAARLPARRDFSRPRRGRHHQAGGSLHGHA